MRNGKCTSWTPESEHLSILQSFGFKSKLIFIRIMIVPEATKDEEILKWIQILKGTDEDASSNHFLDIECMFDKINALSCLYHVFTDRQLHVDDDQNILLELDVSIEGDRNFIQNLEGIQLPELLGMKLINFYECDEDVENLIQNNLTSVQTLHLASEGYCVDVNDYLSGVLQLPCLRCLYLDGFLVDSDNIERLLTHEQLETLSFFS